MFEKKYNFRIVETLILLLGFTFGLYGGTFTEKIKIDEIFLGNMHNPLGVEGGDLDMSWILSSTERNVFQKAYRIQVSVTKDFNKKSIIWDGGKVESEESTSVSYKGPTLKSMTKYYWRVKVWTNVGSSGWSDIGFWRMGLDPNEWEAKWISAGNENKDDGSSPLFRSNFKINKNVESATAIVTSHGLYEAYLNGQKMGDAFFTPGWTSYNKRLQYQMYDVTNQIKTGDNSVGAVLGDGWYRSTLGWEDNDNIYGSELSLLMQILIEFSDGTSEIITTDENWKSTESEILSSEIYNGETIDRRKELRGWSESKYDDTDWSPVKVDNFGYENLVNTQNETIKKHEVFEPKEIITTSEGDVVLDFGQNIVGFVEVNVNNGMEGDSIVLEHAEVLDKKGNFYTDNLRTADQRNTYILNAEKKQHFRPHFTWQGFRYVRIKANSKYVELDNFKAVALYSAMEETGYFSTSNKLLNQLQHNIQWGQKGNFLDVPTDCPQRDERLGWTGDAQAFFTTAAYNMGVNNFFTKWLKDLSADQLEDGNIPFVIPNVLGLDAAGSAGWEDVATIIPWNMYLLYGNKTVLRDQYKSMKAWVDFIKNEATDDLWNTGFNFGDWLFYRPDDDNDGRSAVTDQYLIAQAFYIHSTQLLINTAEVLGEDSDYKKYTALLGRIKKAFLNEYVTPNGRLSSDTQTAYVLALNFDLLPEEIRDQAVKRLVGNIKSYDYHLTTGFLGTPYLNHVLTRFGHHDLAYTLLMQNTYPSWLYPVTEGATTMWERWDGQKPDGSFQTPDMNSFNHYAYGAIGDWMYRELAGINSSEETDGIGYKKIIIKPHVENSYVSDEVKKQNNNEELIEVEGALKTNYGKVKSHWKKQDDQLHLAVSIPVNTTGEIYIPTRNQKEIEEGGKPISNHKDIEIMSEEGEFTKIAVGSGDYKFVVNNI